MNTHNVAVRHGSAITVLQHIPADTLDAVVTDPPYGLSNTKPEQVAKALQHWLAGERDFVPGGRGFMSLNWDSFVPPPAVWDECFRTMKPGAHMAVFTGARTHGIMEMSIRLAGFDIRDGLCWARSGGMPKTSDLGRSMQKAGLTNAADWNGWSAGLKPAIEPIVLARKPFRGPLTKNVHEHGTGALNIDATRIPHRNEADLKESSSKNQHADFGTPTGRNEVYGNYAMVDSKNYDGSAGRWPTNLFLDQGQADGIDQQSSVSGSRRGKPDTTSTDAENDHSGGASRFFRVIDEQLDALDTRLLYAGRAPTSERPTVNGVSHSTVKPLGLMRELVKLITPPGGTLLDPFAGSGTTIEAALIEGFQAIGIEQEADYIPLIEARLERSAPDMAEMTYS